MLNPIGMHNLLISTLRISKYEHEGVTVCFVDELGQTNLPDELASGGLVSGRGPSVAALSGASKPMLCYTSGRSAQSVRHVVHWSCAAAARAPHPALSCAAQGRPLTGQLVFWIRRGPRVDVIAPS